MEKEFVGFKLDPKLKEQLQHMAMTQNRSLSNLIQVIIKNYVEGDK